MAPTGTLGPTGNPTLGLSFNATLAQVVGLLGRLADGTLDDIIGAFKQTIVSLGTCAIGCNSGSVCVGRSAYRIPLISKRKIRFCKCVDPRLLFS